MVNKSLINLNVDKIEALISIWVSIFSFIVLTLDFISFELKLRVFVRKQHDKQKIKASYDTELEYFGSVESNSDQTFWLFLPKAALHVKYIKPSSLTLSLTLPLFLSLSTFAWTKHRISFPVLLKTCIILKVFLFQCV